MTATNQDGPVPHDPWAPTQQQVGPHGRGGPPPGPWPAPGAAPSGQPARPRSRALLTIGLSVLALVLTLPGFVLVAYGAGERYTQAIMMRQDPAATLLPTALMLLGLLLLLAAALLGAWAPLAPVLAGTVVGVLPGLWILADPAGSVRGVYDLVGPRIANPLGTMGALGVPLLLGTLLVACGLACALARRSAARGARA